MKVTALALIALLAAAAASANPTVTPDDICLDLGGSNCVWPETTMPITVNVFLSQLSEYSEGGISSIAFRLERTFPGYLLSSEDLMGGPGEGVVDGEGWVSTASEGCAYPNEWWTIPIARFVFLYVGIPGTLEVQPHAVHGPTFMPCGSAEPWEWNDWDMDYMSFAGVGMEASHGCGPVTPVADASWGSIKALYR